MNNFEATLLISPDLSTAKIKSIANLFEKNVKDMGGAIIGKEDWGLRDLSYKIHTTKKAFYNFYQLSFDGSKIQDLKKILSQNEQILRYLFIKVREHDELPTVLSLKENNEKKSEK